MQKNKNGITVQAPRKKRKPIEGMDLNMRRFRLIDDEAHVEVFVPAFSPILEVLRQDGWEEIR